MRLPFRGAKETSLPIFPLKTVLFPGGILPLRIFEQRYIAMATACLKSGRPFGVCLLREGDEVLPGGSADAAQAPKFVSIGTFATIASCDMQELGILQARTEGGPRFQVQRHEMQPDGLVVAEVSPLAPEPAVPLPEACRPLKEFLEILASRVGAENFPSAHAYEDSSWVGYRLAELLPLPLKIKQSMLEINDSQVRLEVLAKFLRQQGLI